VNIALINASPKKKESNSGALLHDLKSLFPAAYNIKEFSMNKPTLTEAEIKELQSYSTWIFAQPLYIDGIPSHLLSCLCQMEQEISTDETIRVYVIVNGGLFEGKQSHHALAIMENWCRRAGLQWGMGIGYGGGGGMTQMKGVSLGKGPKSTLGKAYGVFAETILSQGSRENIYTSIAFPRVLYKYMAEMNWRKRIKANGGRVKDINRRI